MKYALLMIVLFFVPCAFAGPTPELGERVGDFVERWDAWVESLPQERKAWGLIQEVEGVLEQVREDGHELWFNPEPDPDYLEDQNEWAWTVAFVEQNHALLDKIRVYADRAFAGVPLGDSSLIHQRLGSDGYVVDDTPMPKTFTDMVPTHMGIMRSHLKLLYTDMYLANQGGDVDRVLLDLRAIVGMARLSPTTHSFLDQLVVQGFGGVICMRILEGDVELDQFSDAQLQELMGILEAFERLYGYESVIRYERIASAEFLDWIFEDSDDKGRIGPLGVVRILDVGRSNDSRRWMGLEEYGLSPAQMEPSRFVAAIGATFLRTRIADEQSQRDYVKVYFDAMEADLRIPFHELGAWSAPDIHAQNADFVHKWAFAPALYASDIENLPFNLSHAPTELHAVELLIVLHRSKIRHGEFPTELSDLDADLLAEVPIDLFSGQLLKYKLFDGQLMIYSVGTDRDDDGARPIARWDRDWVEFLTLNELNDLDEAGRAAIDGDWVLYPAVR